MKHCLPDIFYKLIIIFLCNFFQYRSLLIPFLRDEENNFLLLHFNFNFAPKLIIVAFDFAVIHFVVRFIPFVLIFVYDNYFLIEKKKRKKMYNFYICFI